MARAKNRRQEAGGRSRSRSRKGSRSRRQEQEETGQVQKIGVLLNQINDRKWKGLFLPKRNTMNSTTILALLVVCLFVITPLAAPRGHSSEQQIDRKKCPTIEVIGPKKRKGIKPFIYRAKLRRFPVGVRPIFKWSLIGAYVVGGHDSDLITIQPQDSQVEVTLVIKNFPDGCQSSSKSIATEITDIPNFHPPPVVSSIVTSVSTIMLPCQSGTTSNTCIPTGNEVQLTANAVDPYFDHLLYTWFVTAGRLKGEGKTITWDLSGVSSGTYTVTVEVGYFQSKASGTAKVTVVDCTDCKAHK